MTISTGHRTARPPKARRTIRRAMIHIALLSLVFSYVGSYYRLSRRSMREDANYGFDAIVYVPFEEIDSKEGISRHYALMWIYHPLNWIDQRLFKTPGPAGCFMMHLSG